MRVKKILGPLIILAMFVAALQGQEWKEDAERADDYAEVGDYNAAWVFYNRALARGCDDGLTIYRAAEALSRQTLGEDADFARELYAVASYYLAAQSPESPALAAANSHVEDGVKRRRIARTYARLGARLPRTYGLTSTRFDTVQNFFVSSFEEAMQLLRTLISKGPRVTLAWARSRMPNLLLSVLVASLLTGIILPIVMAMAVAREGRKSYVSAYAFLVHWGFLGIHRFYLGRYASGLLWLFTGGLFGLGVFLDLFLTGALVRFWNEDNRSGQLRSRRGRRDGDSLGYRKANMRSKTPVSRTSPSAARATRQSDKGDFVAGDFSDISRGVSPNLGSEKF